jgi:putative endonuclease
LRGWRIVGERVKTPRGEIDLIARRGKTVAFVEVKMRSRAVDLATAIDAYRLRRVAAAAEILLPRYGKNTEKMQIDVILVAPWRWPHHLQNVWHG